MKVLLLLALLISIAFGMTIKSKITQENGPAAHGECLDPNGDCQRPCHDKYEKYGGECPNGDTYDPSH